jgi:hypothetical protein
LIALIINALPSGSMPFLRGREIDVEC